MLVNSRSIPSLWQAVRRKPISKPALCATSGYCPSPAHARNSGTALSRSGASATVSSEMPVSSVISAGIGLCGLT